mmetsp:Transcript_7650/g.21787  ORF Transcript_7650/g.21787 Transcript_7650/m.21787 type:complete len:332 (-) Transcript_7650:319-1314(-)
MLPTFINRGGGSSAALEGDGKSRRPRRTSEPRKSEPGADSARSSRRQSQVGKEISFGFQNSAKQSSIPELPALAPPSNDETIKVTISSVIQIGPNRYCVPALDLKNLYLHFVSLDEDGTGTISWAKLQSSTSPGGGATVFSKKTLQSKAATSTFRRRASMNARVEDGQFNFPDLLRIRYPMAGKDDIDRMEVIAKELSGVRVKSRNYPKPRREAASRHFQRICDMKGRVYMDSIEDFLLHRWPDSNHYDMLKTFEPAILDRLYDEEPVQEEEFSMWYLKLEDMIDNPNGSAEKKAGGKKGRGRPLRQSNVDPSTIYSSYLDSRGTRSIGLL